MVDNVKYAPVDALRCFLEAANSLNFATASRAMHLTPAALGQRIKQLEELVGEPLFERSRRGVTLTLRGSALVPLAQTAVDAVAACASQPQEAELSGEVTIGVRHDLAVGWLGPALPRLVKTAPRLNVHLRVAPGSELVHRLRLSEIDCAVTPTRMTDSKLEVLTLHEEQMAFVASAELLAERPISSPSDVLAHRLLDLSRDLPLFAYFRDAAPTLDNLHFSAITYTGTIAAMRTLVLQGFGVGVLPTHAILRELKQKKLKRLFPKISLRPSQLRLAYRMNDPRRALFEWLANELRKMPI